MDVTHSAGNTRTDLYVNIYHIILYRKFVIPRISLLSLYRTEQYHMNLLFIVRSKTIKSKS